MPSTSPSTEDETSSSPATPQKPSTPRKGNNATTTPAAKKAVPPVVTPKQPPVAPAGVRQRSASRKPEPPTLLADFLLGRQSPARIAAERDRRKSVEVVKAELKQEVKLSQARKAPIPGGVKDRVKAWQKANAAVITTGDPGDTATEPPDHAFEGDEESVTEEDRVRIKLRQKRKSAPKPIITVSPDPASQQDEPHTEQVTSKIPPKKRVVSDENWMKSRKPRKSPPRKVSPRPKKAVSPSPIPKDFVNQSAPQANIKSKVKSWANNVEIPAYSPTSSNRLSPTPRSQADQASDLSDSLLDASETSSQLTARLQRKSKTSDHDGIRVRPVRRQREDEATRAGAAKPAQTTDDGIRIRPISDIDTDLGSSELSQTELTRKRSKSTSSARNSHQTSSYLLAEDASPNEERHTSRRGQDSQTDSPRTVTIDDLNSLLETPTKRRPSKKHTLPSDTSKVSPLDRRKTMPDNPWPSDEESHLNHSGLGSDLASSIANKSIADIPGEIPFGHSAFSELDLPLNGAAKSRPKRPKPERNTSLKSMNVFKKVVEEGKKIIQDMNDPPKQPPVVNKPPSIEKWLSGTVDPFVEQPTSQGPGSQMQDDKEKGSKLSSQSRKITPSESQFTIPAVSPPQSPTTSKFPAPAIAKIETTADLPSQRAVKAQEAAQLKRRRATRSSSSPLKNGGKRQLLGVLKEAFQGESSGYVKSTKVYQSVEQRKLDEDDFSSGYETGSDFRSSLLSDETSSGVEHDSRGFADGNIPIMAGPRFKPPTNGHHQLSTIMSEGGSSTLDSDLSSQMTESTITQSTALTGDSGLSGPARKGSGLKRRLTKHSDLVSVLSLPDDKSVPQAVKNNRSRPSLRKSQDGVEDVSIEELLREFADDENLYIRELKTLVDGVVPVLLSHVVGSSKSTGGLFEAANPGHKNEHLSKSVVAMGVALEKLQNAHRKAPAGDVRRLAHWAHGVVPIYNSYLSAWRLGFQDLVVNLAPRESCLGDEDSLLDALPRNETGDVVNAEGERVDVAHLLKRPLLRVKQMAKLIKCFDSILATSDTSELLRDFEHLQEKARRRYREETARLTDEEASNTDTTRARDLRTLVATDDVIIDHNRQVSAKDIFSLDFAHSNGQRLECQVELVHRDSQSKPEDKGDILIREVGDGSGRRSYLLFPPLIVCEVSARTGDGNSDMVLMVRGTHRGRAWHELLILSADDEDQILDWLDILPVAPVPPRLPEPSVVGDDEVASPRQRMKDVPVGAPAVRKESSASASSSPATPESPTTPKKRALPLRYHARSSSQPSVPSQTVPNDAQTGRKTSHHVHSQSQREVRDSRPLSESMRPDPEALREQTPNSKPYREDGAPPPPVHRSLPSSPPEEQGQEPRQVTAPPEKLKSSSRVRRRTSSPLKHEYLPSDGSSGSETASYTGESDVDTSDDDIESIDIPETEVGFSLQTEDSDLLSKHTHSMVTESLISLTPSNSASQAGLHGHKTEPEQNASRYSATISRWSEKGTWDEVSGFPSSVIVTAGLIEAYAHGRGNEKPGTDQPLLALDLTPLVLIRQSTAVDLEIRSSVQPRSKLYSDKCAGGNFRFRCHNAPECFNLYMAVHHARLNNQKFIQLENEARFKSFGERKTRDEDGDTSSRRRSWFGRKNSYRGSVRAPSQSQDGASTTPSSNLSASSFLKRLTVAGSLSFNLARSSVDKQSRAGSGGNSLYTSGSSSASGTPRSPSISVGGVGNHGPDNLNSENMHIRLHLLVTSTKWEDFGNCSLQVRRPPPGWRQALRADHGLEKRITVTSMPKKASDPARIVLDAVLGSGCFSPMGNRGIVCGIWEELKDVNGVVGGVPATGATGGNIKKWCFQFSSVVEANWVLRLVHQEVLRA